MTQVAQTNPAPPLVSKARPAEGVVQLILANPKARNALSLAMMAALRGEIEAAGADPGVRAVILAAEGPAFCAGHDLKELTAARAEADGGKAFYAETFAACAALMVAIVRCPVPVIAQVHGMATAAGCQLVATCDLAVAADAARFATPGVNIGLFCSTPMVALSRAVQRKPAMEMLLTGEPVSAQRARDLGLVNRVCPVGALETETLALAAQIASKARQTLAIGKAAFYAQAEMALEDAYRFTAEVMTRNMLEAAAREGIGAFLEKRPPDWPKS